MGREGAGREGGREGRRGEKGKEGIYIYDPYDPYAIEILVCMLAKFLTQELVFSLGVSQNGLKYPEQGLGQLVLEVVCCVYGDVVLQDIDRVL